MILPGPGKVVLTTFHHASSQLIDLYLSHQPSEYLQQIQGGQQILDQDRWGQDSRASSPELVLRQIPARKADTAFDPVQISRASSPELARRTLPAREVDTVFDPVRRTGSTTVQTAEEALLFPQVSRSSVVDQSWERIGVTGNHPIWSEDRHDYIAAMDLRVGERLKNVSGDAIYVQQKLPRPGPTPVYNLEVQDEHVYYVGTNGVLAHNVGDKCDSKGQWNPPDENGRARAEDFHRSIVDDVRAAKSGFESGRHNEFPREMVRQLDEQIKFLRSPANPRDLDAPYEIERLLQIRKTYERRAGAGHRGGGVGS